MTDQPLMSDRVGAAIEGAARDAVAETGGMVTGFVGLVTFLDAEGGHCWSLAVGQNQGMALSLGMADILEMTVRAQVEASFFADPDGES